MSDVESYTGKLIPVELNNKTIDEWIMDKLHTQELGYYSNWVEALEDNHYQEYHYDSSNNILYKIEKENFDNEGFMIFNKNDDNTYSFTTSFYNGGTYLGEMLQNAINDQE